MQHISQGVTPIVDKDQKLDTCPACGGKMRLASCKETFFLRDQMLECNYQTFKCLICKERFTTTALDEQNLLTIRKAYEKKYGSFPVLTFATDPNATCIGASLSIEDQYKAPSREIIDAYLKEDEEWPSPAIITRVVEEIDAYPLSDIQKGALYVIHMVQLQQALSVKTLTDLLNNLKQLNLDTDG